MNVLCNGTLSCTEVHTGASTSPRPSTFLPHCLFQHRLVLPSTSGRVRRPKTDRGESSLVAFEVNAFRTQSTSWCPRTQSNSWCKLLLGFFSFEPQKESSGESATSWFFSCAVLSKLEDKTLLWRSAQVCSSGGCFQLLIQVRIVIHERVWHNVTRLGSICTLLSDRNFVLALSRLLQHTPFDPLHPHLHHRDSVVGVCNVLDRSFRGGVSDSLSDASSISSPCRCFRRPSTGSRPGHLSLPM